VFISKQHYFLIRAPTDIRNGFAVLSGLVRQHMSHNLMSGEYVHLHQPSAQSNQAINVVSQGF